MRRVQNPTIISKGGKTTESHPAYGQISVFRGQGSGMPLYGSDFLHNNVISIEISTSCVTREVSNDFLSREKKLLKLSLSEAQWASFVGGVGNGTGTQCTFDYVLGEDIPSLPKPPDRKKQYSKEVQESLDKVVSQLASMKAYINDMKISQKAKQELDKYVHMATQGIKSNLPFVAEQFEEHMETTVERAKMEIHGHMQNTLMRAGLEHLKRDLPLELEINTGGNGAGNN
jgi:hypothetical protein